MEVSYGYEWAYHVVVASLNDNAQNRTRLVNTFNKAFSRINICFINHIFFSAIDLTNDLSPYTKTRRV